ncbi:restriction endonuclease [Actinopolymorpha alba]|uniref:restriction endonuclease n=1 Tax=Actinopolymorpha alba TaxID=533267 RepID=UPI00039B5819|nr:restriction endonuclease [Actinopolymorpha alba]
MVHRIQRLRPAGWRQRRQTTPTEGAATEDKRRGRPKRHVTAQEHRRQEIHVQQLAEDAVVRTDKVEQRVQKLGTLLRASLSRIVQPLDFERLKEDLPALDLGTDAAPLPLPMWEEYAPKSRGLISRLLTRSVHRSKVDAEAEAEKAYASALERYRAEEAARQRRIDELQRTQRDTHTAETQRVLEHNGEIDAYRQRVLAGDRASVSDYFRRVFESVVDRSSFPRGRRFAYIPESKLLLIEWEVPTTDIIPREKEYRYNKATDSVGVHKWRSIGEVRDIYLNLLAQFALRAINTAFATDPTWLVESVVFNGVVPSDDGPGPCLISMSSSRRHFSRLRLNTLDDPLDLVEKQFGAEISAYPDELTGIAPLLPFDLADPDISPAASTRAPNLLSIPVEELHRLVERLLERMGYAAIRAERSGGGFIATRSTADGIEQRSVIRVRRTPGLLETSEVRGLQSAVRHERADAGLLLTTGGLDSQAYEYAHGRPLRLYDGHSLVALCLQHDLPARIEPTEETVLRSGEPAPQVPEQQRRGRGGPGRAKPVRGRIHTAPPSKTKAER